MALNRKTRSNENSNQEVNLTIRGKDEGSRQIAAVGKELERVRVGTEQANKGLTVLGDRIKSFSVGSIASIAAVGFAVSKLVDVINSPETAALFQIIDAQSKQSLESVARLSDTLRTSGNIGVPLIEGLLYGKDGRKAIEKIKADIKEIRQEAEGVTGSSKSASDRGQGEGGRLRAISEQSKKLISDLKGGFAGVASSSLSAISGAFTQVFNYVSGISQKIRERLVFVPRIVMNPARILAGSTGSEALKLTAAGGAQAAAGSGTPTGQEDPGALMLVGGGGLGTPLGGAGNGSTPTGKGSSLKELLDRARESAAKASYEIGVTLRGVLEKLPLERIGNTVKSLFSGEILQSGIKAWNNFFNSLQSGIAGLTKKGKPFGVEILPDLVRALPGSDSSSPALLGSARASQTPLLAAASEPRTIDVQVVKDKEPKTIDVEVVKEKEVGGGLVSVGGSDGVAAGGIGLARDAISSVTGGTRQTEKGEDPRSYLEKIRDLVLKVASDVGSKLRGALERLPLGKIRDGIKSLFSEETFQLGVKAWNDFTSAIRSGLSRDGKAIKDDTKQLLLPASGGATSPADQTGTKGEGIPDATSPTGAGDPAIVASGEAAKKAIFNYDKLLERIDQVDDSVRKVAKNVGDAIQGVDNGLNYATQGVAALAGAQEPLEIFSKLKNGVTGALGAMSQVSQEIFFAGSALQQMQAIVVGGPYDILIGQNVRLQEQLLATKASIVANNKILEDGTKIVDPGKAIDALGAPVEAAISQIRKDSLELVGITSKELVEVFNIVSQQVSNVNLDLKEAADLTISFAAGLGTIGLPLNQARQEIQSILTGTVDMNSVLAKSLGITNAQLKTWIAQDIVYEKMNQRLGAFVEGNAKAAMTIGGISSNIQEMFDEIGRKAGEPFLDPIVEAMSRIYGFLNQNQSVISDVVVNYLEKIRVAATAAISAFVDLADRAAPLLIGMGKIIGGAIVTAIQGLASGLETAKLS